MRLLVVAALLAATVAGCADSQAPAASLAGRIDGAVLGSLLNPYGNATVVLDDLGWTTTTTPLGGFSFLQVPPGTHLLSVAIGGTSGDHGMVDVPEGGVARIILQVTPFPTPRPYVASLRSHGQQDLAMPGQECGRCSWSTTLPERPDIAWLEAAWTSDVNAGRVIVEAWNGHDLVAQLEIPGDGEARSAAIAHEDLPGAGGQLRITARFSDDFLPAPDVRVESLLHLYYHVDP